MSGDSSGSNSPPPAVRFVFRLPPALRLLAPIGAWDGAPQGAQLAVADDGMVESASWDRSVSYAQSQVLDVAARFLRELKCQAPPAPIAAERVTRATGRSERFAIVIDAKVSIARTDQAPLLA
jgi:hypothetical protein